MEHPLGHFGQLAQLCVLPASFSPFFYPLLNKLTSNIVLVYRVTDAGPGGFFGAAAVPVARNGAASLPVVFLADSGTFPSL